MILQVFDFLFGEWVMVVMFCVGEWFIFLQGFEVYFVKGLFVDSGVVRIDFGVLNLFYGMIYLVGGDGYILVLMIGGCEVWCNMDFNEDFYFYFFVVDWFVLEGD